MKKSKFSSDEKKLFRVLLALILLQSVTVFIFSHMLFESRQVNIRDTKEIDIIVDDFYRYRVSKEAKLVIVADGNEYLFNSRSSFAEYSVDELYNSISEGSCLSLIYYETYEISGRVNLVVDARSENEIYRTIEEYNRGKQGLPVFVVIIFFATEIVFVGIILLYVRTKCSIFKSIFRKITKHWSDNKIEQRKEG